MRVTEKRTQIYLPAELHDQVQRYAKQRGLSIAAVIRLSLEQSLAHRQRLSRRAYDADPLWEIVGIGKSREGDLSTQHDYYLYGTPRRRPR